LFPRHRIQHGVPVKSRVSSGCPPPPPYWTPGRGEVSATWMKSHREIIFVVFHLLFVLDAVYTSCLPFIVEFSNIIHIAIFKNINFYLVYRYLLNFNVGKSVYECLRVCDARGILYEDW